MGHAFSSDKQNIVIVARYSPRGNIASFFDKNVLPLRSVGESSRVDPLTDDERFQPASVPAGFFDDFDVPAEVMAAFNVAPAAESSKQPQAIPLALEPVVAVSPVPLFENDVKEPSIPISTESMSTPSQAAAIPVETSSTSNEEELSAIPTEIFSIPIETIESINNLPAEVLLNVDNLSLFDFAREPLPILSELPLPSTETKPEVSTIIAQSTTTTKPTSELTSTEKISTSTGTIIAETEVDTTLAWFPTMGVPVQEVEFFSFVTTPTTSTTTTTTSTTTTTTTTTTTNTSTTTTTTTTTTTSTSTTTTTTTTIKTTVAEPVKPCQCYIRGRIMNELSMITVSTSYACKQRYVCPQGCGNAYPLKVVLFTHDIIVINHLFLGSM